MALRWWAAAASGYSPRGMKAPRYAHWLVVPALAIGMIAGPTWAHAAAPARGPAARTPAPAPTDEDEAAADEAVEDEPTDEAPPEATPPTGTKPTKPPAGTKPPAAAAPPTDTAAPPTDAAAPPTDAAAPPTDDAAPPTETPPEPTITVAPRPVVPTTTTTPIVRVPPREVTLDPRRRAADDRILFRAGLLAFGVAGAALVPTAVGLHQAAYARRVLDRLDTPSEADRRPEVQGYERTMNRMALITGSVTVASAVAGALLVGLGSRRTKPAPAAAVAPAVGVGTAGVVLRGRF